MSDQESDLLTAGLEQPSGDAGNQPPVGSGDGETPPVDDGTKDQKGLKGMLSSALKDEARLDRFSGDAPVDKLAQSFLELEDRIGRSVVISEEPTDEELSRVRTLLGVPENQDGYDFSDVELPEGVELTEAATKELAKIAYENNLSMSQAKTLLRTSAARERDAALQVRRAIKERKENAEATLRQELGADYDKHLKAGQRLLTDYGDDEFVKELKETGFGNSPALIRFVGKIGMAVSEGSAPRGETPARTSGQSAFPRAKQIADEAKGEYKD